MNRIASMSLKISLTPRLEMYSNYIVVKLSFCLKVYLSAGLSWVHWVRSRWRVPSSDFVESLGWPLGPIGSQIWVGSPNQGPWGPTGIWVRFGPDQGPVSLHGLPLTRGPQTWQLKIEKSIWYHATWWLNCFCQPRFSSSVSFFCVSLSYVLLVWDIL